MKIIKVGKEVGRETEQKETADSTEARRNKEGIKKVNKKSDKVKRSSKASGTRSSKGSRYQDSWGNSTQAHCLENLS